MYDILMKAIFEGIATIFQSFARTVAKNGLAIMLLVLGFLGVIWYASWQHREAQKEIEANKADCVGKIESLEKRLDHCEAQRMDLAIKVAVLEVEIKALTKAKK